MSQKRRSSRVLVVKISESRRLRPSPIPWASRSSVLRRPAIRRVLDAVVGVVLVSLGLRLATERR